MYGIKKADTEAEKSIKNVVTDFSKQKFVKNVIVVDNNSSDKTVEIIVAKNKIKIHDLLRHTSGFTYGLFGNSAAKKILKESDIGTFDTMHVSLKNYVSKISKLPLAYEPGTYWEYGRSIEVLGYLVEVISNDNLDNFLKKKYF